MNPLKTKMKFTQESTKAKKTPISSLQWLLFSLLILLFVKFTLPGYFQGSWSWSDIPRVSNIHHLKSVRDTGISIAGWKTTDLNKFSLGENIWAIQTLESPGKEPMTLYFLPQEFYRMEPQVEWSVLQGLEGWDTDSLEKLNIPVAGTQQSFEANFFRAWRNRTYAVVQWYAWKNAGNANPAQWFWADQQAQLDNRRVGWIAVSLKIPIDPLSEFNSHRAFARTIAEKVQASLDNQIFSK